MSKSRIVFIVIWTLAFLYCLIGAILHFPKIIPAVLLIYLVILFGNKLKFNNGKTVAILFMLVPVFISTMTFTGYFVKHIFGFIPWYEPYSYNITPNFLSTLAGILLYLSIIIRGNLDLFASGSNAGEIVQNTALVVLNILFSASFLSVFVGGELWNIPYINLSSQTFLIFAIALSLLGMRSLAGFIWIGLFLLSLVRLAGISQAMGVYGVVYILSAFVSLGLQIGNRVFLITSFRDDFLGSSECIRHDIDASVKTTKKLVSKAATAAAGVPV